MAICLVRLMWDQRSCLVPSVGPCFMARERGLCPKQLTVCQIRRPSLLGFKQQEHPLQMESRQERRPASMYR